jgi:hypothetical protein
MIWTRLESTNYILILSFGFCLNLLLLIASLEISNDRSNYYSARNGSGA